FQAEDGIRDLTVTGVQTCALPILNPRRSHLPLAFAVAALVGVLVGYAFWIKSRPHTNESAAGSTQQAPAAATTGLPVNVTAPARSEERRVGKECSYRWSTNI